jgi:hypothetical protein
MPALATLSLQGQIYSDIWELQGRVVAFHWSEVDALPVDWQSCLDGHLLRGMRLDTMETNERVSGTQQILMTNWRTTGIVIIYGRCLGKCFLRTDTTANDSDPIHLQENRFGETHAF